MGNTTRQGSYFSKGHILTISPTVKRICPSTGEYIMHADSEILILDEVNDSMPAPLWSGGLGGRRGQREVTRSAVTAKASRGDYDDELPFKAHFKESGEWRERKKLFSFQLQEGISPLQLNQSLYPTLQELSSIYFMTVMTYSNFMITPHCVTKHVSLLQIRYIKMSQSYFEVAPHLSVKVLFAFQLLLPTIVF